MKWLLISCFAFCAGIRFNKMRQVDLLQRGRTSTVIGHILHTIELENVNADNIARLLSSRRYPFQQFYNEMCKTYMTRSRIQDILKILPDGRTHNGKLFQRLFHADCIRVCKVTLDSDDFAKMALVPAQTMHNLPQQATQNAFFAMVDSMLKSQYFPQPSCQWLFSADLHSDWQLVTKLREMPRFWMLYHPACYIPVNEVSGKRRRRVERAIFENQWRQTEMWLVDRMSFLNIPGNLPEFGRWIVQVSLVALNIQQYWPEEDDILEKISVKFKTIVTDSIEHPLNGLIYSFERTFLDHLIALMTDVLKHIDRNMRKRHGDDLECSYECMYALIMGGLEVGSDSEREHWKIMLGMLFEKLQGYSPDPIDQVDGTKIWPLDIIGILAPQLVGDNHSSRHEWSCRMLHQRETVQDYFEHYLKKNYAADDFTIPLPTYVIDLAQCMPVYRRLRFVRSVAMSHFDGEKVGKAMGKLRKRNMELSDILSMIERIFLEADYYNGTIDGRMYASSSFWGSNLGHYGRLGFSVGLALLFDVPIESPFCSSQMGQLLGYEMIGEYVFPDAGRLHGDEGVRRIFINYRVEKVRRTFRSLVPFAEILRWDEVLSVIRPNK